MFGIDDAILAAGASSLISGAFGMAGASSSAKGIASQNAANAEEAQKNRDFQLMMSNTAHTREVADLRNAGLNPILSATGGSGASSPGGSMAVMQNTQADAAQLKSDAANKMAQNLLQTYTISNLKANSAKTVNDTRQSKVAADVAEASKPQQIAAAKAAAQAVANRETINAKMAGFDAFGSRVGAALDKISDFLPYKFSTKKAK